MRLLFIGGTRFVGRAMAEEAVRRGHEVTLFHRGLGVHSPVEGAEDLLGDRDGDLSMLKTREFDATIDVCAYVPRQVHALAEALEKRGGHHVFISTMSVYTDPDGPGCTESADLQRLEDPTTEDVTGETYGGLKVLCEKEAERSYEDDGLTVIRPTYVVGPYDHTGRFTWWVRRIARGGEVLAPGPEDAPMQVIDARDQASWVLDLAEKSTAGVFNSLSPTPPFGFGDLLQSVVRAVGPSDTRLTWVDPAFLTEQGENHQSLPLWTEGRPEWSLAGDPTKAIGSGLSPRPLTETVSDTWDWIKAEQPPLVAGWGIASDREDHLLERWHARTGG